VSAARFSTAREVFAAFPSTERDINALPSDEPPLAFLQWLRRSATPEDAVSFLAYALGRREAVWWAAQSVRLLCRIAVGQEDAPLGAAEAWVRDPLALAAGWSGGNVGPSAQAVVQATPEMTPRAVRTAILVALATVSARDRSSRLQACIDIGVPLMSRETR
jgi:hypothetical protein